MNILAICGAANKNRNTAAMLKNAFDGAMSVPGEYYKDFFAGLVGLATHTVSDESEYVMAYQTRQFEDYSKYAATMFDVEMINQRHTLQFPKDCEAAFDMGKRLAQSVNA